MAHVSVIGRIEPAGIDLLRSREGFEVEVLEAPTAEAIAAAVARSHGVLLRTDPFPATVIDGAPHLKVVSRHGVGYDNVDLDALNRRRIPLAVAASANKVAVAEGALFMMLELAKAGRAHDACVATGDWGFRNRIAAFELSGRELLIVGLGRIGREVARRALAFGMKVMAHDPYVGDDAIEAAGCERAPMLDEALGSADVVSLHLPLSARTRNLIDADRLALMKPGALLVNTARGGLVDEAALATALEEGRLAGAGLDVFASEPPDPDSPLLAARRAGRLGNLLLSPHVAGVTRESMVRMGIEAAQNIIDVLEGRLDPAVIVNHEVVAPES